MLRIRQETLSDSASRILVMTSMRQRAGLYTRIGVVEQ
jgi:hypothetical protein